MDSEFKPLRVISLGDVIQVFNYWGKSNVNSCFSSCIPCCCLVDCCLLSPDSREKVQRVLQTSQHTAFKSSCSCLSFCWWGWFLGHCTTHTKWPHRFDAVFHFPYNAGNFVAWVLFLSQETVTFSVGSQLYTMTTTGFSRPIVFNSPVKILWAANVRTCHRWINFKLSQMGSTHIVFGTIILLLGVQSNVLFHEMSEQFAAINALSPWTKLIPTGSPPKLRGHSLVHYNGNLYLWVK